MEATAGITIGEDRRQVEIVEHVEEDDLTINGLIWKRFTKQEEGLAKCNFCKTSIRSSNTTGMQRHVESKHRKEFLLFDDEKSKVIKARKSKILKRGTNKEDDSVLPPKQQKFAWKFVDNELMKRWDEGLVDYAADSFSSFRQLSSPSFASLISIASRGKIKTKNRRTLSRHVSKQANKTRRLSHSNRLIFSNIVEISN